MTSIEAALIVMAGRRLPESLLWVAVVVIGVVGIAQLVA
jgi:uncharacterized membrane protein YsdA (DUF1294 family)